MFKESTYKILTVLFLIGYNFTPPVLAINEISSPENNEGGIVEEIPIDDGQDILPEGISDPEEIAKPKVEQEPKLEESNIPIYRTDVLSGAMLSAIGQYSVTSTSGIWTAVSGGSNITGINTQEIRWGDPAGSFKSGLRFNGSSAQSFDADVKFLIGDLTHFNWATHAGTAANGATLRITLNFSNPVITPSPTFTYGFAIEETPNTYWLENCKYYNSGNQISNTPCDDIITFPNAYGDKVVTIGDIKYTLKIDGFQDTFPTGSALSKFVTEEQKDNKAYLVGHLSSVLVERPAISIIKKVNGEDANTTPGIFVGEGEPVVFTYVVQNTGNVQLTNISVSDNKGVSVSCPGTVLEAGASMTCTSVGSLLAILGQYTNIGTVVGSHSTGTVTANDPANYMGVKKVDICHATGSGNNPYTGANASMTADAGGHDGHNGPIWFPGIAVTWGDIIPPFDYYGGHYDGKNWNEYGQSILNNRCTIPTGTLKVNKVTIPDGDSTQFKILGTGTSVAGAPTFLNGNTGTISSGFSHTYTVYPGTYSVAEDSATGWALTENTCTNIVVGNGENKECTITNTKLGSLTVIKNALPSSTQEFNFTTNGTGLSDFSLIDNLDASNPSKVFVNLLPGVYSVNETVPSGWYLNSATCSDNSLVTAISLQAGEDITCTFNNIKYASISGHKWNDADGIATTTDDRTPVPDWEIFIDLNGNGVKDEGETRKTDSNGYYEFTDLLPGTYLVKEIYSINDWFHLTTDKIEVTLTAAQDETDVNFINVKYGSIKVLKNVDGNGDGDLNDDVDVIGSDQWSWKINDVLVGNTGTTKSKLVPGTYTIKETGGLDNYHFVSLSCTGAADERITISDDTATINLRSGEDVVCTYENARNLGTLIVKKVVVNDNGGSLEADDFKFIINGGTPIEFEADGQNEFTKYAGVTYNIVEEDPNTRGYTTSYDNCEDVLVRYNQTVTCTITNNDIAPELTVIKNVINKGNDGIKSASDFAITVTGTNVSNSNFQGSENGVTVTLNADSYKVTEDEDTENYTASYDNCEGTINIGEKKTCTITNTGIDHLPSIEVTKEADKTSVDETGENVIFTFTVKNTSKVDTVEILSLIDSVFGDLNGEHACKEGTTLAPNTTCTFTITRLIEGDASGDNHYNKFTAKVKDEEGNETSDDDNQTITFKDVEPTLEVTKTVNDNSIPETGQEVTFTFTVKNTSKESVTITSLSDSVFGVLTGSDSCKVGTSLAPDAECSFTLTKTISGDYGTDHVNVFTAVVKDNDNTTATASDDETITFENVAPILEVTKTVDDDSIPETGQEVTFTFTVKNTSKENVTITSLSDDVFTTLTGSDDCKVGTVLPAGGNCSFTHTTTLTGDASGLAHKNTFTVTVEDNDGSTVTDSDDETVNFEDVKPSIEVLKTAGVSEIPETGGNVTFTYKVTNTGLEKVEITSLYDDQFGVLAGDDDCKVGTTLGAGESCESQATFVIPANTPGDPNAATSHKNIFTAVVEDNDGNKEDDDDDEVVTLTPVPSLKLVKNVVHKYNSDTSITAKDWTLHATGDGGFNYAGDTDEFRFVKAGVAYDLSEEGTYSPQFEASDWTCTGDELTGSTLTLAAEDDVVCTITNTALPATIKIYKDVVDGSKDIYSNDIFKVKIVDGDEEKEISDTEENPLVAVFEGLDAGTYKPEEVDIPDGYTSLGCKADKTTVGNGETLEFTCTNEVIDPILEIEKSNDKQHIDQYAGDIVTYTITVTAPDDESEGTYVLSDVVVSDIAPAGFKYISDSWTAQKNGVNIPVPAPDDESEGTYVLSDVVVSDIAPAGFKYISDSWTAQKNGVNIPVPEPTYDDKGQAKWDIGDMKEGDVVVLTYKTKISLLQNPGNYPDIAWVSGKSIIDGDVLGASTVDPLTPFVGTDVTVIEPVETEEGEVLGASITLPVTGASTYLTLGALIMMILGVITLLLKPFKKLSYALLTGLMAVSFVSLLTPNRVLALDSDIKVRIMQPATPTNKSSFNVGFVALDLNNNSITVECYKDAEVTPFATFIANTGNCPVTVSASGTYTFFVKAKSASGEQKSADVTVVVDLEKPAPVIDYSKAGNVIKFKTPNDGKTKKVEIHRSTTSKYTANEGTRVHTMDVLPNTEYSWTDTTAEAGKTYYYALRTVDALGNVSTIVSDPEVVEVPTVSTSTATTTTTTTAATTGEVAGEKDTAEEGEVAGETDDVLEGEDKEVEKTEDEEEKTDIKETAKKAAGKWYIWVIAIVVIGGVAYYVRRQKRN